MTTVINTLTGDELTFSLPPNEAVVAAHQQITKKNHNTWTYNFAEARRLRHGWICGDFWASEINEALNLRPSLADFAPLFAH